MTPEETSAPGPANDPLVMASPRRDGPIDHFQVFGERRSGTNYFARLLKDNLGLDMVRHYGWKHGFPSAPAISSRALIAVVVRDPVDWLVSFYSSPFAVMPPLDNLSFPDFLRAEWESMARPRMQGWRRHGYREDTSLAGEVMQLDRHPVDGRRFANVLEMRRFKLAAHGGMVNRARHAVVVRYEDIKADPEPVVDAIAGRFGLARPARFCPIEKIVGPKGNPRQLVREEIAAEDMAFIRSGLDPEQEALFGYSLP